MIIDALGLEQQSTATPAIRGADEVISPAGSVTTPDFAAPVEQEVEQEIAIASVDAVHHSSPYVGDCR